MEVPFIEICRISQEQLNLFSQASGDPNEIHLNEEVAKKMGLPGVIAHGMLISSLIAERALRFVRHELDDGKNWKLKHYSNRFKAMTFLDDAVIVGGVVKTQTENELSLVLKAQKETGEVTTTGTILFTCGEG